tara:strand:- start:866 stop:1573 length:708 start_codon:yes stop_codon:yes gene_type:complete
MMRVITFFLKVLAAACIPFAVLAQTAGPPGYIYVTGWYKDAGLQQQYGRAVGPILREHGFEKAVLGLEGVNLRVLEGDWIPGRIMLIKFPSEGHAERFWWSDAYQEAKKNRAPISAVDIAQVDGVRGVTPLMTDEAAYLVFLSKIEDRETLREQYSSQATELIQQYGGQFIVAATRPNTELLEGTLPNATVVFVEFPNVESMRGLWHDPEYRRLSEIRKPTGKWSVAEVVPRPPQ